MSVNVLARDRAVHPGASFASGDKVRVKGGQAINAVAAVTLAWLGKTDSSRDTAWRCLIAPLQAGGTWDKGYLLEIDNANKAAFAGESTGATSRSTTTTLAADGPCLHVITKASGSATPVYYRFKYLTAAWTVENMDTALPNPSAINATQIEIGGDLGGSGDLFVGDIYAAAYYTRVLDRAEIVGLAHSFTAWNLQGVVGFWRFRGKEYAVDLTSLGAVELPGSRVGIKQPAFTASSLPMPRIEERQPRERIWASVAAGGGTTYTVTLSTTQGQAAVLVRSAGAIRSAGQGQLVTVTRTAARNLAAVQTQTLTLARAAARALSLTQPQAPAVTRSVGAKRTASASSSVTVTRSIGKTLSAAQSQAVTLSRQAGRILTAAAASVAKRVAQAARSCTVAQPQTVTRTAAIGAARKATATGTATVVSGNARTATLTASVTATVSVIRSIGKVLRPAQGQTVSLSRAAQRILALTQTTTVQRGVQRSAGLTAAQTTVATVQRTRPKTLTATVTSIATVLKHSFVALRASIAGRISRESEGRTSASDEGEAL